MRSRRGFTLVEIIVVITIVVLLAGILVPALWRARAEARETECRNNLKQIGTALMIYRDDYLSTGLELNPLWLNSLVPDYLDQRDLVTCPADSSKGKEGGKPPSAHDQFPELDEGSSYMYEFSMGAECFASGWNWATFLGFASKAAAHPVIDLDGDKSKSMWGEVKTYQMSNGDEDHSTPYSPTRFPIVRCFWHASDPDSDVGREVLNLSYQGQVFESAASWETTSVVH
jgi:prepilin-type N-terminal cleavage/methylation domain-containing protein